MSSLRNLVIILPSGSISGPTKGAVAIANSLISHYKITVFTLKKNDGIQKILHKKATLISLERYNWLRKYKIIKNFLIKNSYLYRCISLSMGFSADIFNGTFENKVHIVSSIRGNLIENYNSEYGKVGGLLAVLHLLYLRRFKTVISMSFSMTRQVTKYIGKKPYIIRNFIDENLLEKYRRTKDNKGSIKYIYVGSIIKRKKVDNLVNAIYEIKKKLNINCHLKIVGEGVMFRELKDLVRRLNLEDNISLIGNVINPYKHIAESDVFVLPSRSEGISRASLEALYLGIPCILRDVDGNGELINKNNGSLFSSHAELVNKMIEMGKISRKEQFYKFSLLPLSFRQKNVSTKLLKLFSSLKD